MTDDTTQIPEASEQPKKETRSSEVKFEGLSKQFAQIVHLIQQLGLREKFNRSKAAIAEFLSKRFATYLSLTLQGGVIVGLVSAALGIFLYSYLQTLYQAALYSAALNSDPIAAFCSGDPGLDQSQCELGEDGARAPLSDHTIWSLLTETKVISPSIVETPANLAEAEESADVAFIISFLREPERQKESGPGLLLSLTRSVCYNDASGSGEDTAMNAALAYYIAGLQSHDLVDASALNDERVLEAFGAGPDFSWASSIRFEDNQTQPGAHGFRVSFPRNVSDDEILTAALVRSNAVNTALAAANGGLGYRYREEDEGECPAAASLADAGDRFRAFRHAETLGLYIIGQIRRTSEFRTARRDLTVITGPEQLMITLLAVFGLVLGAFRIATAAALRKTVLGPNGAVGSKDDPSFEMDRLISEITSARWPLRLAIGVLPAIGFIGTVRGIMNSLTGADGIVWAATTPERAQAISALAGELGLAFSTTMLALIFGVMLSVLSFIELRLLDLRVMSPFRPRT